MNTHASWPGLKWSITLRLSNIFFKASFLILFAGFLLGMSSAYADISARDRDVDERLDITAFQGVAPATGSAQVLTIAGNSPSSPYLSSDLAERATGRFIEDAEVTDFKTLKADR